MKNYSMMILASLLLLVGCKNEQVDYDASGMFELTELIISAKVQGEIKTLSIEEGQEVSQGRLLGYIDTIQLQLKKEQLLSTNSATTSRLLDESKQVASLREQIANLEKERERFSDLVKNQAATQKQVDDISYQIGVMKKQVAATMEQLNSANTSLKGQSGSIIAQVAQLDDQILNSHITSPISGIILAKYAEAGEFAGVGKPLFKVGDVAKMKLRAYITADQLTNIKIGQKVTVYADQGVAGRKSYQGIVSWIADNAEFTPKTIQTRDERANLVYAIKISVDNTERLIKRGMYGDVKF